LSDDLLRKFGTDLENLGYVDEWARSQRLTLGDSVAAALDSIKDSRMSAVAKPLELASLAEEARRISSWSAIGKLSAEFSRMQYALLGADGIQSLALVDLSKTWRREIAQVDRLSARYSEILESVSELRGAFEFSGHEIAEEVGRIAERYRASIDPSLGIGIAGVLQRDLRYAERFGAALLDEISSVLRLPPFSSGVSEVLERVLGDFRSLPMGDVMPPNANARAREFYARGFDPALASFPRGHYPAALDAARIPLPASAERAHATAKRDLRSRAYLLLVALESKLRAFISARLTQEYGESWLEEAVPTVRSRKWRKRQSEEPEGDAHHPIEYADLLDLEAVIAEPRNWERVFGAYFGTPEEFSALMARLNPWRRRVAHARGGWSKPEYLVVRVEAFRLFVAMGLDDPLDDVDIAE